jgi:hypothetical protein
MGGRRAGLVVLRDPDGPVFARCGSLRVRYGKAIGGPPRRDNVLAVFG